MHQFTISLQQQVEHQIYITAIKYVVINAFLLEYKMYSLTLLLWESHQETLKIVDKTTELCSRNNKISGDSKE